MNITSFCHRQKSGLFTSYVGCSREFSEQFYGGWEDFDGDNFLEGGGFGEGDGVLNRTLLCLE